MAALLVLLLFLALPLTAFTANVYYVTPDDAAGHEQSCPPHQICHNLSYYISQPSHYFTNDTIIIFLEGQHSFDREDLLHFNNLHNLTFNGQGKWPVAGPEETVMQSTVIINCTRGRGGFIFDTGYDITIEGLTITNCGAFQSNTTQAVFTFFSVQNLMFQKNSLLYISGYGIGLYNCENGKITNCSYYSSVYCSIKPASSISGGGVYISYTPLQYSNLDNCMLELTFSNMTKCCNPGNGGGIHLNSSYQVRIIFDHLLFYKNRAGKGGGLAALIGSDTSLRISNCLFLNGHAVIGGSAGALFGTSKKSRIVISNSHFVENSVIDSKYQTSEIVVNCDTDSSSFSLLDSTIVHTQTKSDSAISIGGCSCVRLTNISATIANQNFAGITVGLHSVVSIINSRFKDCHNLQWVIFIMNTQFVSSDCQGILISRIRNCTFLNNSGGLSVIVLYRSKQFQIYNSVISDNSMTGITAIESGIIFGGHNVIQNNRYTEGAGIALLLPSIVAINGVLHMINNTAERNGGAILVKSLPKYSAIYSDAFRTCTFFFGDLIYFSGNTAGRGGDNIYGATLLDCVYGSSTFVSHIGQQNETSYYFETPLMKYFNITDTDRLSSISSDPIMVCFCNTSSNLPDCSNRTPLHIQTYPGLEINVTVATVGYYGGTSPGVVLVSAQNTKLVHFYGQHETIECFQIHILLKNTSSTTALVDINVEGGLPNWGLSLTVDTLECPIGFVLGDQICHCVRFLADNHVQCNVSIEPYKFLRSGNSWFAYINNTHTCITGTTNCPFDYCNRSNVSFDIMAPALQCLGNRSGILCGQCPSHLSIMLGSNRCGTCSNWYLFLLPVFALAGIVLVAVLLFLNLSVSVGTINGLLFYANMVKLNEAFFFPNGSIPVVSQFISWLNLDLGIEVCLFDGQDGYWNTWLQYVFPAYLFLLMGGIIMGCRYSVWLCRLCGSHAVPALATLFLMSYTKILLTVTNALSMSRLPCNDSILTVWSVDGNIEYGSGKHLILMVFSCGVLIIGLAYPLLVLCAPLLERYSHKCIPHHRWNPVANFKPLLDAYGGPYKDKYRFWTGVTLMVRVTLTLIFSFTSGGLAVVNAYIIITVIVGIFTVWSFTNGVYKSLFLSGLEVFYILNIFFLSSVSLMTASLNSSNYRIASSVSICFSFLAFLITVVLHIQQSFDLNQIKRRLGFTTNLTVSISRLAENDYDDEDRLRPGSPPSVVYGSRRGQHQFVLEIPHGCNSEESLPSVLLEREPLLYDDNISS